MQRFAAVEDLAALLADGGEGVLHVLHGAGVDQRPHERAGLERVADGHLPVGVDEAAGQRLPRRDSCTMMRRVVVQRWPAVPTAPKRMARMARSRSAVGATMMALLPPSSSRRAAQAAGDDLADVAAHPGRAGGGDERDARVVDEALADGRAVADDQAEDGRVNVVGAADALGDLDGGDGGERRLAGGLPDGGIAADGGQRAVPGPDGDGEVEGGDDADDAERVPLLHHPVLRALGGDGQAVELAREADGEVADVDHLLHFAFALGEDLAGISSVTSRPRSRLASRRALPSWRTISPRLGAGTSCHFRKACCARWAARSYSSGVAVRTVASTRPSMGEMLFSSLPLPSHSPQKTPGFSASRPSFLSRAAVEA